jgi:hypothetical protein
MKSYACCVFFVLHGVRGMLPSGVVLKMVDRLELGGHVAR